MKKVFLFLGALSLATVISCSSDDDSPSNPPTSSDILVKRVVYSQDDPDGYNATINYSYNGNKLVQGVYNDGTIEKYYYTGDRITKIEYIYEGVVTERDLFTYNAENKLSGWQYEALDEEEDIWETWENNTYTYNSDNTITQSDASGSGFTRTMTMQNGEISQIVGSDGTTYTYTYDSKNSPFKNVTGYAEIVHAFAGDHEMDGRARNIISIVDETNNQNYTINTMQYNANDYPTSVTSVAIFDPNFPNVSETLNVLYSYE